MWKCRKSFQRRFVTDASSRLLLSPFVWTRRIVRGRSLHASTLAADSDYAWGAALAARVLGRIELCVGRFAESRNHLERALQGFTEMEAKYDVAWAHVDLALLARVDGDPGTADATRNHAITLLRALGVQNVEQRIDRLASPVNLIGLGPHMNQIRPSGRLEDESLSDA
jgi:hypothetical protein